MSEALLAREQEKNERLLALLRVVATSIGMVTTALFALVADGVDSVIQWRATAVLAVATLYGLLWRRRLARGRWSRRAAFLSASLDTLVAVLLLLSWSIIPEHGLTPLQIKFGAGYAMLFGAIILTAVRFDYRPVLLVTAMAAVAYSGVALVAVALGNARFVWPVMETFALDRIQVVDFSARLLILVLFGGIVAITTYMAERLVGRSVTATEKKHRLRQFVSQNLAIAIESGDIALDLSGHRRRIAVLFCDIRGFTALCERLTPEASLDLLNRYYLAVSDEVFRHHGTLDKYMGDGVMALFGAPVAHVNPSLAAVRCALALLARNDLPEVDGEVVRIGVGVHTDEMVVGNLGTEALMSYTAIGRGVNLAARIESATSGVDEALLFSDAVKEEVERELPVRRVGEFELKGIGEPTPLYAVERP